MIWFTTTQDETSKVGFFNRRALVDQRNARKEAEAEQLKLEGLRRLRIAEEETKKINTLLKEHAGDISFNIFLSTGGDRRMNK